MGYSLWLTARLLLYAPSHRQDSTYHSLCYTSRGALAGTRNNSMGPPHEGSIRRPIASWVNALTTDIHLASLDIMMQHTFCIIHLINNYINFKDKTINHVAHWSKLTTYWPLSQTFTNHYLLTTSMYNLFEVKFHKSCFSLATSNFDTNWQVSSSKVCGLCIKCQDVPSGNTEWNLLNAGS